MKILTCFSDLLDSNNRFYNKQTTKTSRKENVWN